MKTFAGFRRAWVPPHDDAPAHPALAEFVETKLRGYADDRDFPGRDATSRLSPLIAGGELTIAACASPQHWRRRPRVDARSGSTSSAGTTGSST